MITSIVSCNVSSEECDLFQSLSLATITNIESNIESILGPDHIQAILSAFSSAESNRPSGIKPTDISKLWIIQKNKTEGEVDRDTQLMENKFEFFCLDTSRQIKGCSYIEEFRVPSSLTLCLQPQKKSQLGVTPAASYLSLTKYLLQHTL